MKTMVHITIRDGWRKTYQIFSVHSSFLTANVLKIQLKLSYELFKSRSYRKLSRTGNFEPGSSLQLKENFHLSNDPKNELLSLDQTVHILPSNQRIYLRKTC